MGVSAGYRDGKRDRPDDRWNRLHGWLETRGWTRLTFGNSPRYTPRVAGALRARIRALTGGDPVEAYRLAVRMLGLRARTETPEGSRWDCTTRMFQIVAQARRLAGISQISYTGYRSATRRVETVSGQAVYSGEHLSGAILSLMAVAHYRDPRLGPRNLRYKTALLPAGGLWSSEPYGRTEVGDILFYPDYGPGHFCVVLHKSPEMLVVVEGYWRGQATVIHLYPRSADISDACLFERLGALAGYSALGWRKGDGVTWERNVVPASLALKGPLRVAEHR